MDLFIPNKNRDSVTHYKLAENYWREAIIRDAIDYSSYYKPTIIKEESCTSDYSEDTDKLFYSGDSDVCILKYRGEDYVGERLASNVGVACSGCDHYYEDVYKYKYDKYYLIKELASAIRCYYSTLNFDIASARSSLNRIRECLNCTRSDVFYISQILDSLSFNEVEKFTNLDDLARFILSSNSYDRVYSLKKYKKEIEGLDIRDLCSSSISKSSYTITTIKSKLCDYEKGRELIDFLPEVKEKKHELSRIKIN